jgi:hypothetical protein
MGNRKWKIDMKKLIFFLFVLQVIEGQGQNDEVYLTGEKNPINCRIIEVSRDSITYLRQNEKVFSSAEISDISMIRLFASADTASYTTKDLFTALPDKESDLFTWYGIDFSFVRICDPNGISKYSNDFFQASNEKILYSYDAPSKQPFHFHPGGENNVKKTRYLTGYAQTDLSYVGRVNDRISMDQVFDCDAGSSLPLDTIRKAILDYGMAGSKKGIGAVVFYRQIMKDDETITAFITFFDILTGTVLFIKRQEIKGGGMTVEWHWTAKLLPVMNKLRNSYGSSFNGLMTIYGIE